MTHNTLVLAALFLLVSADTAAGQGQVSDNIRIESSQLGYALQYRVYTPEGYQEQDELPVLYLTDGQWYLQQGNYAPILDELIAAETIFPVIAVFVDNRNPDDLSENRRNGQFFCNPEYEDFVSSELVPAIDAAYNTRASRESRSIMGLSFGGLNAACFALHEHETFGSFGLQSPATRPIPSLHTDFLDQESLPIRVFLSSGDHRDNEEQTRRLRDILESRVIDLEYVEVPFAHTWANWGPLLDDAAVFFFGME